MEHGLVRIPSPALAVGRIGTEHVIVGEEVFVAEILGGLSVVSDYSGSAPISLCGKVTPTCTLNLLSEFLKDTPTKGQVTQQESPRCERPLASLSSPLDVNAPNASICY